MPDDYSRLLDATINHLESLKAQGVRFVQVSPESLASLGRASSRVEAPPNPPPHVGGYKVATPPTIQAPAPVSSDPGKVAAFAELRARAKVCVKCPNLAASRKNVVFGVGNIDASLMFVGEAPGADEDEQGEPFVGKAGQLLTKIIQTMGLSRASRFTLRTS